MSNDIDFPITQEWLDTPVSCLGRWTTVKGKLAWRSLNPRIAAHLERCGVHRRRDVLRYTVEQLGELLPPKHPVIRNGLNDPRPAQPMRLAKKSIAELVDCVKQPLPELDDDDLTPEQLQIAERIRREHLEAKRSGVGGLGRKAVKAFGVVELDGDEFSNRKSPRLGSAATRVGRTAAIETRRGKWRK